MWTEFNGIRVRLQKHYWKDPYRLQGDEKRQCLQNLLDYVEWYKKLKNPSFNLKELYFDAVNKLDSEARRQLIRYSNIADAYGREIHKMQTEELTRYQMQLKANFLNKLIKNNNKMTPELASEYATLTKMEQVSCYVISGLRVMKRECKTCGHQSCKYAESRTEKGEEE
jgi:hypothetical protein